MHSHASVYNLAIADSIEHQCNTSDPCFTNPLVSSPDPTLKEGKGSGELGLNPWVYTDEFPHTNEISTLAQSRLTYCRNATDHSSGTVI